MFGDGLGVKNMRTIHPLDTNDDMLISRGGMVTFAYIPPDSTRPGNRHDVAM